MGLGLVVVVGLGLVIAVVVTGLALVVVVGLGLLVDRLGLGLGFVIRLGRVVVGFGRRWRGRLVGRDRRGGLLLGVVAVAIVLLIFHGRVVAGLHAEEGGGQEGQEQEERVTESEPHRRQQAVSSS
ncbi:hypothetical protein GOP47_0027920 [Adiantum capillus-veneris]|nr:hypothetical protein GOP47_0027919 [Adiantum capillus-veneris]KAI5057905.1 hypothetical protein GOP47_0027920 [Adiantum capillus-veneris]